MASTPSIRETSGGAPPTATRILDVAEELFADRGFAAVSVRDIAGRVGLNQASLYNHFASKQALYEAVLERGLAPIRNLLEAAATELDGVEAGDDFLDALVAQLWRTPHLPKLLQREILDDGPYLDSLAEQWLRPIVAAGRQAMAASVPELRDSWPDRDLPFVILGMYGLLFGHFVSAALTRQVLGADPLSEETRRGHAAFVKKATRRLMGLPDDSPG